MTFCRIFKRQRHRSRGRLNRQFDRIDQGSDFLDAGNQLIRDKINIL
jgi:hypothetical protein